MRAAGLVLACVALAARAAAGAAGADAGTGAPPAAGAPAAVEISVLSYNVHGLPSWIAGDDPPARLRRILEKAAAYDVALLQEEFAHHDLVAARRRHPLLLRGNGARIAAPLFQGAGLTFLARAVQVIAEHAAPYGVCHGWIAALNDCFGHKGFQMARLVLANGAAVDFWNTHLDAGSGDGDHDARVRQLDRLAREIEARSARHAVVLGGDLNADWNVPRDRALLERFAARLGLRFAASTPPGAWLRRIDYLLARSGADTAVEVLAGGVARDLVDPDGAPLSDHPAVYARLRVRPTGAP